MAWEKPQHLGGSTGLPEVAESLYIETRRGYTPKGDIGKNTFLCYPTFWEKETSCKEIA
jgi:hypothetical protein